MHAQTALVSRLELLYLETCGGFRAYIVKTPESSAEMDEDEFVDAVEEQQSESDRWGTLIDRPTRHVTLRLSEEHTEHKSNKRHEHDEESCPDSTPSKEQQDDVEVNNSDRDDLFQQFCVKSFEASLAITVEDDDDDEDEEVREVKPTKPQLTKVSTHKATSTPAAKDTIPLPPSNPSEPGPPRLIHDISPTSGAVRWHNKAIHYMPRLPLASKRYWIGVLHIRMNPHTFSSEHAFTWMRGNRLTTVETVRNMYATITARDTAEFELMLAHERLEDRDTMEELDLFADEKVVFRAVEKEKLTAEGVVEGISRTREKVPEVIDLVN